MKTLHTTICTLALLSSLAACRQEEVELYGEAGHGVYFNYRDKSELQAAFNFSEYVVGLPQELPHTLRLKVMGHTATEDRRVVLKTRPLEGYPMAEVTLPGVVFTPDTLQKEVVAMVKRPAMRDTTYAAVVYIDPEDPAAQIGEGVDGFQEFTIYASEEYSKPGAWGEWSMIQMYLGDWSADKQIFYANLTGQDAFYENNDYYTIVEWNAAGVDSIRTWAKEHPGETPAVDIPFTQDYYDGYPKPWYWTDTQAKWLGAYTPVAFVGICNALGITTANEQEAFTQDTEGMERLNAAAAKVMMEKYNNYYSWGYPGSAYRQSFHVPMFVGVDYEVVRPAAWEDGGLLDKYYGGYSDMKYAFMVKEWLKEKGSAFALNQLTPVMGQWTDEGYMKAVWDSSMGGEKKAKELNAFFRKKTEGGGYGFTFPEVK